MMFSATFPNEIQRLAGDFLRDYVFLAVGRVGGAAQDIEQRVMYVEEQDKNDYLLHELENWGDGRVLIFVETKRKADILQHFLYNERFYVASIHGDRSQSEREEALNAFKSNEVQILVATDVAARGLDLPNIETVINYHLPPTPTIFVHRSGRTARGGSRGLSLSLVSSQEKGLYHTIAQSVGMKNGFASFPLGLAVQPQIKECVTLARKISEVVNAGKKTDREEVWLKKTASEADLEEEAPEEVTLTNADKKRIRVGVEWGMNV